MKDLPKNVQKYIDARQESKNRSALKRCPKTLIYKEELSKE
ncbi:MAG TPA: hypothetical protein VFF81_02705 [Noviherbaspirillum sp.]|nr:hypothetical protein [Noviherbaspirillum sp.]